MQLREETRPEWSHISDDFEMIFFLMDQTDFDQPYVTWRRLTTKIKSGVAEQWKQSAINRVSLKRLRISTRKWILERRSKIMKNFLSVGTVAVLRTEGLVLETIQISFVDS